MGEASDETPPAIIVSMTCDDDLQLVLALERELQTPGARADVDRLRELLAPGCVEVGASGTRWGRDAILDLLAQESGQADTTEIEVSDLHGRRLGDDLIQVFWDSHRDGRRARRTSLWQSNAQGWQQIYHQGTPLP